MTARRRPLVAGLLFCLLLVATGCGSNGRTAPLTTLRVLMTDDWVTPPFLDAVKEFERTHKNVRVLIDRGPIAVMSDAVRAGVNSGAPHDVVQGHAFAAAGLGLAEPLDDVWQRHLRVEEFFPGAIEDVTWAGRWYGVPLDTNAMVLIYNADHFKAANIPEPRPGMTFGDFENMARALTTADGSRRALAIPTSTWWTYGWIKANGGETVRVGPDGKAQLSLDAEPVVQAVGYLAGLIKKGYAFPPRAAESHSGDALALFSSGSASIHASGSWDVAELKSGGGGDHYRVTLMPRGTTGTTEGTAMGGSSLFVPKGSQHRDLAVEFMVHLISDRYALRFAKEEGRLPVRERVFGDPFFQNPDMKVFLEQLKSAHPPKLGAFEEPDKEFAAAIDAVLRERGAEPTAALREAQQRAVASLDRP